MAVTLSGKTTITSGSSKVVRGGVWVRAVVPSVAAGTATIYLNASVTTATFIAWFVVNQGGGPMKPRPIQAELRIKPRRVRSIDLERARARAGERVRQSTANLDLRAAVEHARAIGATRQAP